MDTHAGPWHFGPRGGAVHDRRTREHRSGGAGAAGDDADAGIRAGTQALETVRVPKYYRLKQHLLDLTQTMPPGTPGPPGTHSRARLRHLAHHRPPGAGRAGGGGPAGADPGQGHLRGQAEGRAGAAADLLHRGHARAGPGADLAAAGDRLRRRRRRPGRPARGHAGLAGAAHRAAAPGQRRADGHRDHPPVRQALPRPAQAPGEVHLAVHGAGRGVRRTPGRGRGDHRDRAGHAARGRAARHGHRPADAAAVPALDRRPTGEPVEWVRSVYRGDRYKFLARLQRPDGE